MPIAQRQQLWGSCCGVILAHVADVRDSRTADRGVVRKVTCPREASLSGRVVTRTLGKGEEGYVMLWCATPQLPDYNRRTSNVALTTLGFFSNWRPMFAVASKAVFRVECG